MSRRFTDIFLFFFYFCMTISTKHEAMISVHHNYFSGFNSIVSVPEQTKNILPEYQTLLHVEQIMAEQPDSALYILEHLPNPTKLTGEAQALYALLLTQARYKNYIPVTNDPLIRIAENYYLQHPDSLHKAWTFLCGTNLP